MAFETLEPHRKLILELRAGGKTLAQIADHLQDNHKLATTPGTLSRFLKLHQPSAAPRPPTQEEHQRLDLFALLTEITVEIRSRSEEERRAIEHLAGRVGVLSATVGEVEQQLAKVTSPPAKTASPASAGDIPLPVLRRIWQRALLIGAGLGAAGATLLTYLLALVWRS
jgi:hypothetical protein